MKTHQLIVASIFGLFTFNSVFADSNPGYQNNILTIPSVDSLEKPGAYQDVIFTYTEQGEWQLSDYKNGVEAETPALTKIEIIKTETFPVQVFLKISYNRPSPCNSGLGQVGYRLVENKFEISVYLDDYEASPELGCIQVIVPTTKTIPLPVYSLAKGEYQYSVNNGVFTGTFELTEDNEL